MKKYLRYAALPAFFAAPAFAGNLQEPVVEPVIAAPVQVQPISDWTGFYLGAQAGYGDVSSIGTGNQDLSNYFDDIPVGAGFAQGFSLSPDGGLGGLHAGYLHDVGQLVIGGELDYDWSNLKDSTTTSIIGVGLGDEGEDIVIGNASADLKVKNVARAKLLVGYDMGDGLLYGTAGAFRAKVEGSVSGSIPEAELAYNGSYSGSDNGWLAGVGYKHKFNENWIGGVEALYHKASDFDDTGFDLKMTTITARISYKF